MASGESTRVLRCRGAGEGLTDVSAVAARAWLVGVNPSPAPGRRFTMIGVTYVEEAWTLASRLAAASSNAETVRTFVHEEYGRVVGAVTMAVGSRDLAEDAVQDALVKILRDDHHPDRMAAWVTVIAINEARRVLRRRGAESRAIDRLPPPSPSDPFHEVEFGGALRQAVAALPERGSKAMSGAGTCSATFGPFSYLTVADTESESVTLVIAAVDGAGNAATALADIAVLSTSTCFG